MRQSPSASDCNPSSPVKTEDDVLETKAYSQGKNHPLRPVNMTFTQLIVDQSTIVEGIRKLKKKDSEDLSPQSSRIREWLASVESSNSPREEISKRDLPGMCCHYDTRLINISLFEVLITMFRKCSLLSSSQSD